MMRHMSDGAAPTRKEILDAARVLPPASLTQVDSPTVKSIINFHEPTDRQVRCLWNILRKYRSQLSGVGVEYDALVPPAAPPPGPEASKSQTRIRFLWCDNERGQRRIAATFMGSDTFKDPRYKAFWSAVKKADGAYFDKEGKNSLHLQNAWVIPGDVDKFDEIMGGLETIEPAVEILVDPGLKADMDRVREERRRRYEESRSASADLEVPTKLPLRPFQKAGVKWIDDLGGRALIADEMGLGKTVQALGWMVLRKEIAIPAVVVCSSSLRPNWVVEAAKFTDFRCQIISGKTSVKSFRNLGFTASEAPLPGYDLTVVNYDLFSADGVKSWIKLLVKGSQEDKEYAMESLVEAGLEALDHLKKAMVKNEGIEARNLINRTISKIEALGDKVRKAKWKLYKYYVNGIPLGKFLEAGFKTLVSDESHYLKDYSAQRTKAVIALSRKVKNSIALTGTPLMNRPKEAYSQVQLVNPKIFPVFLDYGKRFCGAHHTGYGWDFSGASHLDELDVKLRQSIMIRRLKSQVLKELPEKIRITTAIALGKGLDEYKRKVKAYAEKMAKARKEREEWRSQLALFNEEERRKYIAKHAEKAARASKLTGYLLDQIEEVKQAAVAAKMDEAIRFIQNAQEQQGKVLVFMTHYEFIDKMKEALADGGLKVDVIDGRVDGAKRSPIKDRFQEGDLDVLICGIRAASEGLTLTASHTVVFCEFDWNPARHHQAEDRVHRIGQTVAPTIYYLVALGTVEESIAALIDGKREVVNAALGEGERTMDERGIMDAVLDELLAKEGALAA